MLADFDEYLPQFQKADSTSIIRQMVTLSAKLEEKGMNSEQAQMEAFYESIQGNGHNRWENQLDF